MAHEVHYVASNGVWMHEASLLDPEQVETISNGVLLPSGQRYGDTISRDALDNEIDNAWPSPKSSADIILKARDCISRMSDYNEREEGKSPDHIC